MPNTILTELPQMRSDLNALEAEQAELEAEVLRLQNRQDAVRGQIAAEKLPVLYAEKAANEKKIAELQERQRYCEIQLKICEKKMKEYERKQRNRRIFTRGGMLEAFLIEPLLLSDEDVHDFLEKVFRMPEVVSLLRKLIDDACTLEDDESEKDAEDEENGGPFVEGRNYTP